MVKKVAQYMADVLEDSRDKVQENLLANGGTVMIITLCVCFLKHDNAKNSYLDDINFRQRNSNIFSIFKTLKNKKGSV